MKFNDYPYYSKETLSVKAQMNVNLPSRKFSNIINNKLQVEIRNY